MKKTMSYFFLFCFFILTQLTSAEDVQWPAYKEKIITNLQSVHGWCSPEKASRLMELVYRHKPEVCVEIGVFGGASIVPIASALKYNRKGIIHAIDSWNNSDCLVGYTEGDPNYEWWSKVNLEEIYQHFILQLKLNRISKYCNVIRATSEEALEQFKDNSIDLIHIDGNHTEEKALFDAVNYLPKVKKDGVIIFDDANWPTTFEAICYLLDYCELENESNFGDPYLVFIKN